MSNLKKGWINDKDGNNISPFTTIDQILNLDGSSFQNTYSEDKEAILDNFDDYFPLTGGDINGKVNVGAGIYPTSEMSANTIINEDGSLTHNGVNVGSMTYLFKYLQSIGFFSYDAVNKKVVASIQPNKIGTTEVDGQGLLALGNNIKSKTNGNSKGVLAMYGINSGFTKIETDNNSETGKINTLKFPYKNGTLATTEIGLEPDSNIPENSDLNDIAFLEIGRYTTYTNNITRTLTNSPTEDAFYMEVISPLDKSNLISQNYVYRLRLIITYTGYIYIQSCYKTVSTNTWIYGNWNKLSDSSDIPTKLSDLENDMNFTDNVGTITEIIMNNESKGTSGSIDLGTIVTDISNLQDKATAVTHTESTESGSTTTPVYISSDGIAVPISYSIEKSVPSDAIFTDTWRGIQNNLESESTEDSLSAAQGKELKSLVDGKADINHTHSEYLPLSAGSEYPLTNKLYTSAVSPATTATTTINSDGTLTHTGYNIGISSELYKYVQAIGLYSYDAINKYTICGIAPLSIGTTDSVGKSCVTIGNTVKSGIDGNSRGEIRLYGELNKYTQIVPSNNTDTAHCTLTLPNKTDTLATLSDLTGALIPNKAKSYNIGSGTYPYQNLYGYSYKLYDGTVTGTKYGDFYVGVAGTTSTQGKTLLTVGNTLVTGTAGNAKGEIYIYGTGSKATVLYSGHNGNSGSVYCKLPSTTNTTSTAWIIPGIDGVTTNSFESKSITQGNVVTLGNITLSPGIYTFQCNVKFGKNSSLTDRDCFGIYVDSTEASSWDGITDILSKSSTIGSYYYDGYVTLTKVINISSSTTMYVGAYLGSQNAGANTNVTGVYSYYRLIQ